MSDTANPGNPGLNTDQSKDRRTTEGIFGHQVPRIHTPLDHLPSKGDEMIKFAEEIGLPLLEWQKFVAINAHKIRPDGRWASSQIGLLLARQNGKSTFMEIRILAGMYLWNDSLQIGSAHRLTTSLETFRRIVSRIEANDRLASEVKKIRWAHGSEEVELKNGNRFMVKAGGAAARGISKPETVYLDEIREHKDVEGLASTRYTMMAAKNPQVWAISNAGDQHSVVLNQLRERAIAKIAGAKDDISWFEWSAKPDAKITLEDGEPNWDAFSAANPSLGYTIHPDNLKAVLNDPPDVVRTEVLCQWVKTISAAIPADEWHALADKEQELDLEKETWLGLDLSPDRRHGALVAAQKIDQDRFLVKLLHTWNNPVNLDDKAIANDIAPYCRKYQLTTLAYSKRTASAVAARLIPAGIPITDIDGGRYSESCDQMLGAITSKRMVHTGQAELDKQVLSAVKLPYGDGSWCIGRRASQTAVCAAVAVALVSHFATQQETEVDIQIG